ncbi:ABC transporter ATP-binding protein [Pseudochelatococcus sp. B33]
MNGLELDRIGKDFGGLPAVQELSLSVPKGQITGLIGPNGAGKTTVVNMIMGLLRVSRGTIRMEGQEVTTADAQTLAHLGVARTFQNIRLLPHSTVLENVVSGFHRHETTTLFANLLWAPSVYRENRKLEAQAKELLEEFGMIDFARHPAGSLSYGHQRRIEMMRALAMHPKVLLLDEPVAGMNDAEAYALAEIFEAVARRGVGILLIEHNMRFVRRLCAQVYVLASGRLIAEGAPDAVVSDPRVVEAYLGS